jgi:lipoate---protein ligase
LLERGRSQHWWLPASRAVVLGLGLGHRAESIVDVDRCEREGVAILRRKAGGGAVFLDDGNVLCGAIAVHTQTVSTDVTESYRWLGEALVSALNSLGVRAHRVEVEEARADVAALRAASSPLLYTCYGALSPHELTLDGRKLVGLAQIRRRETTLYVLGILLRTQSRLADFLINGTDIRDELDKRTVGLEALTSRSASEVAAAIADAMPFAP